MPAFANVIVLKIQEFSRRPVAEQTRLKAQLEGLVALVIQPLPAADRIVLDVADGVALVVMGSSRVALEVAERSQAAAADLPLCIGINHGPVTSVEDTRRGDGVAGDGIAVGMTVTGAAAPGRFLMSRPFHEALQADAPECARDIGIAGTVTDPNVRTHELYAVDPQAPPARRRRMIVTGVLSVIGIIGLGFAARGAVRFMVAVPPAIVKFEIRPEGDVYVDGVLKGRAPALKSIEMKPGLHAIEIRNDPHPPLKQAIQIASAEEITITHSFERPKSVNRAARKQESAGKSFGDHWRDLRRQMGF